MSDKKTPTVETVAEYLARSGNIETIEPGASGVQYPVRRTRKAHVNFLKDLDRKRLAEKGVK
jgi:hypothetical protein